MIRLESSGNDCTMGAGFRENSVYSTYTLLACADDSNILRWRDVIAWPERRHFRQIEMP